MTGEQIREAWGGDPPGDLVKLWGDTGAIYLFYTEGAEGLEIFGPKKARIETGKISDEGFDEDWYHSDDLVMGKFQGIDDRLLWSPVDGWLVADSIANRPEWVRLGLDLRNFLKAYRDAEGVPDIWIADIPT